MSFLYRWGWLVAVVLIAGCIRFIALEHNPCGLFRDEVRKGYSTYSLLETGRDLTGRPWPLQVKEFSAYTTPLYHWFSLPFIAAMGLTPQATRFLAALAGTLACGLVALLAARWNGRSAGALTGLLLAISPWHFLFSRWANQGILMTLFIPLGVWAAWRTAETARDQSRFAWGTIAAGSLAWGLAWNAYEPARVFVPLFLLALIGIEWYGARGGRRAAAALFFMGLGALVVVVPFVVSMLSNWEETRLRFAAVQGEEPLSVGRFLKNYALHWNPIYLLASGDANPRHNASPLGQLTALEAVGIGLGVWMWVRTKVRWGGWLIAWLLLAPVPAALTHEGLPHALRTLMITPAVALLAGLGLVYTVRSAPPSWRRPGAATVLLFVLIQAVARIALFGSFYPEKSAAAWDKGFYEGVRKAVEVREEGDLIVISGLVEFPEAMVEFVVQPDPKDRQAGKPIEGFRFLPTGKPVNPMEHRDAALFLVRPGETRQPPWWREVDFFTGEDAVQSVWRLYASEPSAVP